MEALTLVVLAAGGSRRLGRPKQLVLLEGEPLVRRAARIAFEAGLGAVRVVLGCEAERVGAALEGLVVDTRVNPRWAEGMASSIRCGLGGLTGPVLLLTCDQPAVSAAHLRALAARAEAAPIVASAYAGARGVPALFAARLLGALRALEGDRGARAVIAGAEQVAEIPLPGGERDIDTGDQLRALTESV